MPDQSEWRRRLIGERSTTRMDCGSAKVPLVETREDVDDEASENENNEDEELFRAVLAELRKPQEESGNPGALLVVSTVAFIALRFTLGGDALDG